MSNNEPTPASWLATFMLLVLPGLVFLALCAVIYLCRTGCL